jgi:hypothetical protein
MELNIKCIKYIVRICSTTNFSMLLLYQMITMERQLVRKTKLPDTEK